MSTNLLVDAGDARGKSPVIIPIERREIMLPTGILTVDVHSSDLPLDSVCGFAARRNPKRGFLFVSKVLGKHIPVRPSLIRDVHTRLARQIPEDLPGPVVVIGMAETAIALGHGVFDEYVRLTGRKDVIFLHSTRYATAHPLAIEFKEEHSHAADHLMYVPVDWLQSAYFKEAQSLVLVDDEASTGKTFVNLGQAMIKALPKLRRIVTAVITDWRGPERLHQTLSAMPVESSSVAVVHGQYSFTPDPGLTAVQMPNSVGNGQRKDGIIRANFGRLGLDSNSIGAFHVGGFERFRRTAAFRRLVVERNPESMLVLGTGEFAYPPFCLAERLEQEGVDVMYQSTTRSPIMEGLSIGCSITFADNYGDGINNYIYNAAGGMYQRVLICHETPSDTIDSALVDALGAETLEFS